MVDEYEPDTAPGSPRSPVQIPLWSMNTPSPLRNLRRIEKVQIPLWSMNTLEQDLKNRVIELVQIPLWSMNTKNEHLQRAWKK